MPSPMKITCPLIRADDLGPLQTTPSSSSGGKMTEALTCATTERGWRNALSEYRPAVETIKIIPQYLRLLRNINGWSDFILVRSVTCPRSQLRKPALATVMQKSEE